MTIVCLQSVGPVDTRDTDLVITVFALLIAVPEQQ